MSKYDGRRIVNYVNKYKQGKAVTNLMENNGIIWCQDFACNFYYTQNDSLVNVQDIAASGNYIQAAIVDNKTLVSVNVDSVRMFDIATKKSKNIFINDTAVIGYSPDRLRYILSCYKGVRIISNKKIELSKINMLSSSYLIEVGNTLYGISKNKLPYIYDLQKAKPKKTGLPLNLFIQEVCKVKDEIWICTSTGAYCFNKNFEPKYNGHCFFKDASISKVIVDNEGSYWFSTLQNGIFYVPDLEVKLLLPKQSISTISIKSNNDLFIGTVKGQLFQLSRDSITILPEIATAHEIEKISVESESKNLLIGKDVFIEIQHNAVRIIGNYSVKDIVKVSNDLWAIATSAGALLYSRHINKIYIPNFLLIDNKNIINDFFISLSTDFKRTKALAFNSFDSTLFIGAIDGLKYFSKKGRGNVLYNNNPILASHLYTNNNCLFAVSQDGVLIIKNNKVVDVINQKNGLPGSNIGRCAIRNNTLWIICNNQVFAYNILSKKLEMYPQVNSILIADLNDIAVDANSNIYLATNLGLLHFSKQLLKYNTVKPIITLTHFFVNNKATNYIDGIELDEHNNDINFQFSANAFKGGDSVKISYQINNKEWIFLPIGATELPLNALGYGKYQISVKAINESGIESNILRWNILVKTPFYRQFWFVVLVVLLAMMLVAFYFRYQLKKVAEKNKLIADKLKLEEELQSSMMASIKSQMNPHFLFNALNTIQSYIYTNDKINATQYLSKFSKLTRQILEMSDKETVLLSEEISALELYIDLEKTRFEDKLTSTMNIENNVDIESVVIPSMLIQPYIENAIKHGLLHKKDNRILSIVFAKENNTLVVTIDDNGIGRKRSAILNNQKQKQHESFAVNANKKRLEILQKNSTVNIAFKVIDKTNENGEAAGTTVILTLPINTIGQFK